MGASKCVSAVRSRPRFEVSELRRPALFSIASCGGSSGSGCRMRRRTIFAGANGESNLIGYHGCFAWYELLTTDVAAAKAFYGNVLGWEAQDASTPDLSYTLFAAGKVPTCGVMELPEEGRRMGARPRWMGYVGVDDIELTTGRIKRLGGSVFVPPTDTNIGCISVVADPQTAIFALVAGLKFNRQQPLEAAKPGRVGWHELLAADWEKAFAFYGEIFGWQKPHTEISARGALSPVLRLRADDWRHVHPPPERPASVLAALFQCRGHPGCRGAREGRRRRGLSEPGRDAGGNVHRPMRGPARSSVRAAGKAKPNLQARLVHRMERLFVEGQVGWSKTPRLVAPCTKPSPVPEGWKSPASGRFGCRCLGSRLVLPLRPGDVVCDDRHDRYSGYADK